MNTIQMITFLGIFIIILIVVSIKFNKEEKEYKIKSNREALEAENTEFDYGHNVKHTSDE